MIWAQKQNERKGNQYLGRDLAINGPPLNRITFYGFASGWPEALKSDV